MKQFDQFNFLFILIESRWHTALYMLSSVIENHEAIKKVKLSDTYIESPLETLSHFEITECNSIIQILQPYERCSTSEVGKIAGKKECLKMRSSSSDHGPD